MAPEHVTAKEAVKKRPNQHLGLGSDHASRKIFKASVSSTSIREDCCSW
jgi:hypothetical protein